MFRKVLFLFFISLFFLSDKAFSASYTVDPAGGGTWTTLAQVNSATLVGGDIVSFRAGYTYSGTLTPKSGTVGSGYVTYNSYGTGTKPLITNFNATGKSYAKAIGLAFSSSSTVINLTTANHIIIDGCTITSTATSWSPGIQFQSESHYNQIINNTISELVPANNDLINMRGNCNYNLIQNNIITIDGIHAALDMEGATGGGAVNYNIIKGNTLTGINRAGCLINLATNSNYNVVEYNTLTGGSGIGSYCGVNTYARHEDMFKLLGLNNIVRFNIIKDYPCANSLGITMEAYYNIVLNHGRYIHVYNNIITNIAPGGAALSLSSNDNGYVENNYFKNNAIYNNGGIYLNYNINGSGDGAWTDALWAQTKTQNNASYVRNNTFTNNLFYSPSSTAVVRFRGVDYTATTANALTDFAGNIQSAPTFDSTFRPLVGSSTINTGTFLTTVTSASGSGNSFTVADAWYFSDGRGLITGDVIQVGATTATISSINYGTNSIAISGSPITWTNGMNVSLPYFGSSPDIGVYEYGSGGGGDITAPVITSFTIPSTASSLTVGVTTFTATDAVGVTGYCALAVNNNAGCSWTSSPPSTITFSNTGLQTAYAWARDTAGNTSNVATDTVTITIPTSEVSTDSFTDTNGTLLTSHTGEVGAIWTANTNGGTGTAAIGTNRLHANGSADVGLFYASGASASANYVVSADLYVATNLANAGTGITIRQDTASNTAYVFQYLQATGSWALVKLVNGAYTSLGTYAQVLTTATTYNMKVITNGSLITCYVNDVLRISITDTSITAIGKPGVRLYLGNASTGYHLDNFSMSAATAFINASGNVVGKGGAGNRATITIKAGGKRDISATGSTGAKSLTSFIAGIIKHINKTAIINME